MHTFPIHYLKPLSREDCRDLLAKHAFGTSQSNAHPKLEMIGRKIADKCAGLPIAAEALGGLLRTKRSEKDWCKVLESNIWDLPDDKVLPPLLLSYHYLPARLKGCFAYCAIFPKYFWFDKMVVRLWMAEGLVHQFKGKKNLEEIGDAYFDELVSRSLIQRRQPQFNKTLFKLHDLINDLATFISAGYCFRYEDPKPNECLDSVRHLSYERGMYDCNDKFEVIYGIKGLRTIVALPVIEEPEKKLGNCYITTRVLHDLIQKMRHLRVLSLSQYDNITELPDSIGNFIHLRYLDLSFTKIKMLPDRTCKLYNLQTLLLSYCEFLIQLPRDMEKLINLRHLDLRGTKLKKIPSSVSKLKDIRTLTNFFVSKQEENGLKVRELRNFPHLRGKLSILNLQNVVDPVDAFHANLINKREIEELALEWGCDNEDSHIDRDRDVLDKLQPSTNLKRLSISFYGGTSFPNWLGDSSFCNMVSLCISDCNHCLSLPPLGQLPALKRLGIERLKSLKTVRVDFYGRDSSSSQPFPSLEYLYFDEMSEWEEWVSTGGIAAEFPSLQELSISICPKLRGSLPNNLPSLKTLCVSGCDILELQNSNDVDNTNIVGETEIPPKRSSDFKWISSLQTLSVHGSPGILSLLETGTLPFLDRFEIGSHDSLQLFPRMTIGSSCLQSLYIDSIPSLTSFQQEGLPTSLTHLNIFNCEKLEFLPLERLHNYSSLVLLDLFDSCHSMEPFPLGSFPVLDHLHIHECTNLKSFSISDNSAQSLSHLKTFYVTNCPNLDSFPQGGLPTPNLQSFWVYSCEKLKSLPERINTLTGLQKLCVDDLPCLVSFAEEGLPVNLRELEVFNCGRLSTTSITQWGSQRLTSLTKVTIGGDNLVDSLMKNQLLTTSLESLRIRDISFLDGNGLQHLTSLENLKIESCPNLESLPEMGLQYLISLENLEIESCPNLEFLPEMKLPASLSVLSISHCPLLEENYQINRGKNWSKIAHIPCVKINEEVKI